VAIVREIKYPYVQAALLYLWGSFFAAGLLEKFSQFLARICIKMRVWGNGGAGARTGLHHKPANRSFV